MLGQEDDPYLYYECLAAYDLLTHLKKDRNNIFGGFKLSETPSVRLPQSSE